MYKIVLPQAIKNCLPPIVSQCVMAIKDTSVLSVIGLKEMTNVTRVYVGSTYKFFETYIYLGLVYLLVLSILMIIARRLEVRLNYEKNN